MKIKLVAFMAGVIFSACGGSTGGGTGGGSGGNNGTTDQYPERVHLKLTLKYSTTAVPAGGDEERWQGTFEGNSSASRLSGINQVYDFDSSLDTFTGASHYKKTYDGQGGPTELTDTVDALAATSLSLTVGPTSANIQTGQLIGPFYAFLTDETSFGSGIRATTAAQKPISFSGKIPAKLDSRCSADPNVTTAGAIAIDGSAFTGFTLSQTYTCTLSSVEFKYENTVTISAL